MKSGDKQLDRVPCVSADSGIYRILTLHIVSGSLSQAIAARNSAVISRRLAARLFGRKDPVEQLITVNWAGQPYLLQVSAVMADIPSTSTFKADCILPIYPAVKSLRKTFSYSGSLTDSLDSWTRGIVTTYILLSNPKSASKLSAELVSFSDKRHLESAGATVSLGLFSLKRVYFHSRRFLGNRFPQGSLLDMQIYSAVALLTLLIACINFMILSIARARGRMKEIGVRKVVGASRLGLFRQFLVESMVVVILSLPLGFLLVEISIPAVTQLLGKELPVAYYHGLPAIGLYLAITIATVLFAGTYVAVYLSGFSPIAVIRNKFSSGDRRLAFRRILIGVEMVIFVGLISASITIYRQLRYLHDKDMGFDPRNLVVFSGFRGEPGGKGNGASLQTLRDELKDIPDVVSVSAGSAMPITANAATAFLPAKQTSKAPHFVPVEPLYVNAGFVETMGMKMEWGKTFGEVTPEQAEGAIIINRTAMKEFGITNPSEQLFAGRRILGVVRDFNMHSLHDKIIPVILFSKTDILRDVVIRFRSLKGASNATASVEKDLENFDGGKRLSYQFYDDRINELYGSDYRFAGMIGLFTGLAIFVACLGLFGVSLFVTERLVKEIGIRKVLGASVMSILLSSVREFVILLLISTAVSVPISFYLTNAWLNDYAYHINVSFFSVLVTLLVGAVIVILTTGYEALKAATVNPVESLRYE